MAEGRMGRLNKAMASQRSNALDKRIRSQTNPRAELCCLSAAFQAAIPSASQRSRTKAKIVASGSTTIIFSRS